MRAQKRTMCAMAKEFSTIVRVGSMWESGIKIKCMVKEFFTIPTTP